MRTGMLGLATIAALGFGTAAAAAPGLGNAVYSPYVKKGVTEVEVRGGRLLGGEQAGDSGAVIEFEHGFSDRLSLAVVGEIEDEPGDRRKLDSIGLEGVAYFGQVAGVDVGGYLEYEQRIHNESGKVEGKLLLARRFGPVNGLLNIIAEQALTNRPGQGATEFGYAAQGTVDAGHKVQVGLQAFGDLGTNRSFGGRQQHFLGPVVNWELHPRSSRNELELQAAYLLPLGQARRGTDGQVRVALEWETRF